MTLDFFGLFDYTSGDGDIYEYTATEFNTILKAITGNGVVKDSGNEMAITANGLTISVDTGIAFCEGRIGQLKAAKTLTLDAAADTRTDLIVMRVDVANRLVSIEAKKGTTALTQTEMIYEIPLAEVAVAADGTTTITDKRQFIYTPKQEKTKMNNITAGTETVYARYA